MIKVNVIVNDKTWFNYIKSPKLYIKKKISKIQKDKFFLKKTNYSLNILLSGNNDIKKLNKQFRKKNKSTDILSFPFQDQDRLKRLIKKTNDIFLGDIIINIKKLDSSSVKKFKNHLNLLWIHGLLHLFGYDHRKYTNFKKIYKKEKKFLRKIN